MKKALFATVIVTAVVGLFAGAETGHREATIVGPGPQGVSTQLLDVIAFEPGPASVIGGFSVGKAYAQEIGPGPLGIVKLV